MESFVEHSPLSGADDWGKYLSGSRFPEKLKLTPGELSHIAPGVRLGKTAGMMETFRREYVGEFMPSEDEPKHALTRRHKDKEDPLMKVVPKEFDGKKTFNSTIEYDVATNSYNVLFYTDDYKVVGEVHLEHGWYWFDILSIHNLHGQPIPHELITRFKVV